VTNWIARWVISGVALAIVANLNLGVKVDDLGSLAMATIVIGLVNSLVRPIVMLLTLPLNCITFGLFGVVVNAILFGATKVIVPGFHTDFLGAVIGSALMGIISSLLSNLLPDKKKK
jgi:putative membrane protein